MGDSTPPPTVSLEEPAQPAYDLSSFTHILERIAYYADNKTRLTLLRTTTQLFWIAGPLAYRQVYLDKRTLAGVFLGRDVEAPELERPVFMDKERGGTIRTLATGFLAGSAKGKGVAKGQSGHGKTGIKAKAKGREAPHVGTNFKAPLLRLVKVITITKNHHRHCEHLADTAAGALISLDVRRIVPPKYDHLRSFKQLCKGHNSCPLAGRFDTKNIVLRNISRSGFPVGRGDLRSWSPPSLQEVVCFLAPDGSLISRGPDRFGLSGDIATMFWNVNKVKMVFIKHGEEPTPTDRPYPRRDGPTLDQLGTLDASTFVRFLTGQGTDGEIPTLYDSAFVHLVQCAQQPGRILEIFGLENVRLATMYLSRSDETGEAAAQDVEAKVCEALRKANDAIEGNTEANLVFGSIDEYWARGDWTGEVNDKEVTKRIRSRQWARRDARRDARWMAVREELHRAHQAGNFQCNGPLPNEVDFSEESAPYWLPR